MKSAINPTHIFLLTVFLGIFFPGSGVGQTPEQIIMKKPQSFSLLYSSNVAGEYEPCG